MPCSRITRIVRVASTCALLFSDSALPQATFHGSNARTGVYDSAGPAAFHGVHWRFKTGGPVIASPAIADGVVFIGSSDGVMYALDQNSGEQKWKLVLTNPISSSAAIADGVVYFLSYDRALYAVAAATGGVKWMFATGGEQRFEAQGLHGLSPASQNIPDPMDLYLSSPAVDQHRVYFGSSDGHVYALDAATGVLMWSFETGAVVHASPAVVNGTVYIGSWDSYLYALDAATGRQKWRFKSGEDPLIHNQVGFQSSPAVVDDTVYVGCRDGHVYALDAHTGKKRWDYSTSQSWVNGTPAVRDGVVYVGTSDTQRFHGLDAKTGRMRFVFDAHALVFSSPAIAGELVYFGAFNGRIYALDVHTGQLVWQFQTDGAKSDPLKILSADGDIDKALQAPVFNNFLDMTVHLYKLFSAGAVVSSPVVDHGSLYFGSADGNVYAIH
jgi:eukaryotic-like serine/threonine-protein kinase